jgi:hypothetical protein
MVLAQEAQGELFLSGQAAENAPTMAMLLAKFALTKI